MLIRANRVLTMRGEPIAGGAVRTEGARIAAVGRATDFGTPEPGEPVIDLGDAVLLPGLINAHCHLDYTGCKGLIDPPASFAQWIQAINALKRQISIEDYVVAVRKGFQILQDTGTTTVANIESFPEVLTHLDTPPIRTWWFLELIDVRHRIYDEAGLLGALNFFENMPTWLGGFGLSPHSPYTASIELYRLAKRCCEQFGMPFTTHISESVQEQEMFRHAHGELFDLMASLGRDMSDCGHGSSLSHLLEHGVLTRDCLAVHMNYLQDYDLDAMAGSGVHVVHCPKCPTYFGHAAFRLKEIVARGVNVCLGTDSLASNNSLDLRSEMREVLHTNPSVTPRQALEMVTLNPARALNQEGLLGEITPNAWADLLAVPLGDGPDPHAAVIDSRERPLFLAINGDVRIHPGQPAGT
jgi:aminodeoxyfutalosine deaminase